MNKEETEEFERTIRAANVRLVEVCGDKIPLEDVVLTYDAEGGVLRSGSREIARIVLARDTLKMAKKTIWCLVDATKEKVNPRTKKVVDMKEVHGESLDHVISSANKKLEKMTEGGFPFTFNEVRINVDTDSVGVYVRSGVTPVVAVRKDLAEPELVEVISREVWDLVDATRVAIERRSGIKSEAANLEAESSQLEAAEAALKEKGLSSAEIIGISDEISEAIYEAAKKAVSKANRGLGLLFGSLIKRLGGLDKVRLSLRRLKAGLIVSADGKPCLVSRFPKVRSNRSVEKTLQYITEDISSLGNSRRRYLARLRTDLDREEAFRELADLRNMVDRKAAAM